MNDIAYALCESANEYGVLFVLQAFGNDIQVRVPLSNAFCKLSIEQLDLSVRSKNGLMRSGAANVRDICDIIMSETGLEGVRNLGKKSIGEIKTMLLVLGYEKLNDREKMEFWHHFVTYNEIQERFMQGGDGNA